MDLGIVDYLLKVEKLKKSYQNRGVLDVPYFELSKGTIVGLIGNNGAGKTTFLRSILDLIEVDSGRITWWGEKNTDSERWKDRVSSYIDERYLIPYLTPREFFEFVYALDNRTKNTLQYDFSKFDIFFSNEILLTNKLIRDLSTGNKSKIGIASALMQSKECVLLDEPFSHLDPSSKSELKKLIKQSAQIDKTAFILSSHDIETVYELCDKILLLSKGEVKVYSELDKETKALINNHFEPNPVGTLN